MTTRDAGLTKEQVEAAEVHAAGSSHCGEIKSKSAFSRDSTCRQAGRREQTRRHRQIADSRRPQQQQRRLRLPKKYRIIHVWESVYCVLYGTYFLIRYNTIRIVYCYTLD
jgi:hypothetical protein